MFQNLARTMGPADTLKIRCICGHGSELSQPEAFKRFGAGATPYSIRRRVRCSRCFERGMVSVSI